MSLREDLQQIPDDVFWRRGAQGNWVPAFNAAFGWILRQHRAFAKGDAESIVDVIERELEIPNLSTFQRSMAQEAKRRESLEE